MNYAREVPLAKNEKQFDGAPPAFTSNQASSLAPSASSVIGLSDKTTLIELTCFAQSAGQGAILGRWGASSVTSTAFDFVVPVGSQRQFVVPVSIAGIQSVAGANVANGLYSQIALKNANSTIASVLLVEY